MYSNKNRIIDFQSVLNIIFPKNCSFCENEIGRSQHFLCSPCWEKIEPSYMTKDRIMNSLNFRLELVEAYALFDFSKNTPIQSLIHEMKYNHQFPIAIYLGEQIGIKLMRDMNQNDMPEAIVPIPLHYFKEFERGFNQSESIAKGISIATKIVMEKKFLKKKIQEKSQTKKNIHDRKINLENKFKINNKLYKAKHILIVDDIFTTGATLEAAYYCIKNYYPEMKISYACIALTRNA